MSTTRRRCTECGEPTTFAGADLCGDCAILQARRKREREYVPLFGEGRRLSGATGMCPVCGRRGCFNCEEVRD